MDVSWARERRWAQFVVRERRDGFATTLTEGAVQGPVVSRPGQVSFCDVMEGRARLVFSYLFDGRDILVLLPLSCFLRYSLM